MFPAQIVERFRCALVTRGACRHSEFGLGGAFDIRSSDNVWIEHEGLNETLYRTDNVNYV